MPNCCHRDQGVCHTRKKNGVPNFWQVRAPFENLVRGVNYLLTLKFVPTFRRIRDSIEILEVPLMWMTPVA